MLLVFLFVVLSCTGKQAHFSRTFCVAQIRLS